MFKLRGFKLLFGIAAIACAVQAARAEEPVSFKGQRITILIGYGVGGGYDLYGRLAARYLSKYLPGNPSIVVRNMPGAQGVTAINYALQQTRPDGLTIIAGSSSQADPLVTHKSGALYDPVKLIYVGGVGRGGWG